MTYRADIDGLRALAVVPVVLYHAGVPGFGGGFVGVDVFFVISGYLIAGMIDADLRRGAFGLGDFYKRRIMRIMPAFLAMLVVTSAIASVVLLPEELKDYALSLVSAVLSTSNMYFADTAGYFDAPALTKPLLHTWSLGVEEQFYLVVPVAMLGIHRWRPAWMKGAAILATVLSALLFLFFGARNPVFAFYLAPCRAWELALGALLSLGCLRPPRSVTGKAVAGTLGLGLIVGAILFASPDMPIAVVSGAASLGALLVIGSSGEERSWVGRLLARRPLVAVGLLSYSLYLWHWPLIVFARSAALRIDGVPGWVLTAGILVLSALFAALSWRFVEQPMRRRTGTTPVHMAFGSAAVSASVVIAFAGAVFALEGLPARFSDRVVAIGAYIAYDPHAAFRTGECYLATNRQTLDIPACLHIDPRRPNDLLVGDSHAAHLWLGLSQALDGVNVMQATAAACRPLIAAHSVFDTRVCPHLMDFVFDDFLRRSRVDRVILSASWKDEDLPALAETLQILRSRGQAVVVLGPIVEYDEALPRLLTDGIRRNAPRLAQGMRTAGIRERDRAMRSLATANGATYVSVYDAVCRGGRCDEYAGADVPLQFDEGHLTAAGSVMVAERLRDEIGAARL